MYDAITYASHMYRESYQLGDSRVSSLNDFSILTKFVLAAIWPPFACQNFFPFVTESHHYSLTERKRERKGGKRQKGEKRKSPWEDGRNSSGSAGFVFSPRSDLILSQYCKKDAKEGSRGKEKGGRREEQNSRSKSLHAVSQGGMRNFAKCVGISSSPLSV